MKSTTIAIVSIATVALMGCGINPTGVHFEDDNHPHDDNGAQGAAVTTLEATAEGYQSLLLTGSYVGPVAESHGFCFGADVEQAAGNCEDLGPLTEAAAFERVKTGLQAGKSYVFWAFADTLEGEKKEVLTDAPSPVITASTSLVGRVEVSWEPLPDVLVYRVYRDDESMGEVTSCAGARCAYVDETIVSPSAAQPAGPTDLEVKRLADRVELTWSGPAVDGPSYTYRVVAEFEALERSSNEATGFGAGFAIDAFEVERRLLDQGDAESLGTTGADTTSFSDLTAAAPKPLADMTVSQGTSDDHVALSIENLHFVAPEYEYRVILFATDDPQDYPSDWVPGSRLLEPDQVTLKWYRGDTPASFEPLTDASEASFFDTTADESGSGHFYQVRFVHETVTDLDPFPTDGLWGFRSQPATLFVSLGNGQTRGLAISGGQLDELDRFSPFLGSGGVITDIRVTSQSLFTSHGFFGAEDPTVEAVGAESGFIYHHGWFNHQQSFAASPDWERSHVSGATGSGRLFRGIGLVRDSFLVLANRGGYIMVLERNNGLFTIDGSIIGTIGAADILTSMSAGYDYFYTGVSDRSVRRYQVTSTGNLSQPDELSLDRTPRSLAAADDIVVYALVESPTGAYQLCRADFEQRDKRCTTVTSGTIDSGREVAVTANKMIFVLTTEGLRRHANDAELSEIWFQQIANPSTFTVDTYGRAFVGTVDGRLHVFDRSGQSILTEDLSITDSSDLGDDLNARRVVAITANLDNPGGFPETWNPYQAP
jgi:hypothetical protein